VLLTKKKKHQITMSIALHYSAPKTSNSIIIASQHTEMKNMIVYGSTLSLNKNEEVLDDTVN
jgi:hypothetical protein